MSENSRIHCPALKDRIMSAEAAAELIPAGANVGMSGFTGAGYPKAVPGALAERIRRLNAQPNAKPFRINVWTGASTAPELDGVLAEVDGIEMRLPFQSDPICRSRRTRSSWKSTPSRTPSWKGCTTSITAPLCHRIASRSC